MLGRKFTDILKRYATVHNRFLFWFYILLNDGDLFWWFYYMTGFLYTGHCFLYLTSLLQDKSGVPLVAAEKFSEPKEVEVSPLSPFSNSLIWPICAYSLKFLNESN